MLPGKTSSAKSCIGSQNIVYIVKALVIGCKVLVLHMEGKLVAYLYIMGIILDRRSCKTAGRAFIIP